ncbi:calmodulin-binding transcription activator 5 [Actinidia rufa]|uniref:Calmodulin-binding transcription activator 5 n=1 Tax=Actinidia rufa TaxID=165716 RepID=A0A7J0FRC4_9ERIC|nr:calmodulin-binding transcription activator 5 [Actinidia rufa]
MSTYRGRSNRDKKYFSLELINGGKFVNTPELAYRGGSTDYAGNCHSDMFSLLEISYHVEQLEVHWVGQLLLCNDQENHFYGLKLLLLDTDVLEMIAQPPHVGPSHGCLGQIMEEWDQVTEGWVVGQDPIDVELKSDYDQEDDDDIFEAHVDEGVEWAGSANIKDSKWKEEFSRGPAQLKVGILFASATEFKQPLREYAIQQGKDIAFVKNETTRVRAVCTNRGFGSNTNMPLEYIQETVKKDYVVGVSRTQACRGRRATLKLIDASDKEQYYCAEIRNTNPHSTVIMKVIPPTFENGQPIFGRIYTYLGALKHGFKAGCRNLVCMDACLLTGVHGGIKGLASALIESLFTSIEISMLCNMYTTELLKFATLCQNAIHCPPWKWSLGIKHCAPLQGKTENESVDKNVMNHLTFDHLLDMVDEVRLYRLQLKHKICLLCHPQFTASWIHMNSYSTIQGKMLREDKQRSFQSILHFDNMDGKITFVVMEIFIFREKMVAAVLSAGSKPSLVTDLTSENAGVVAWQLGS